MPTSIIIVDDFFSDAEGFRDAGLRLAFPEQDSNFQGRSSSRRLKRIGTVIVRSHALSSSVSRPRMSCSDSA